MNRCPPSSQSSSSEKQGSTESQAAMEALMQRILNATGPNRDLDHEIQLHLMNEGRLGSFSSVDHWLSAAKRYGWNSGHYTASLDASLALVERLLPGWHVQMNTGDKDQRHHSKPWAKVVPNLNNDAGWKVGAHDGRAANQPLAILTALLRALLAQLSDRTLGGSNFPDEPEAKEGIPKIPSHKEG
jgi:hypothetical protein